ncbi:hypothetical protein QE152_g25074 [Popillia japonica]|uniref:Uncharacterized protein n=1 Tax=Popillia japonica TaxID=7064 RepID=A0AAW1K1V9_POPJA
MVIKSDEHTHYCKYQPVSIVENNEYRLYWAIPVTTDKPLLNNIPDIVQTNKLEKKTYVIDIAVSNTDYLSKKYQEKLDNYMPLAIEIKTMWKQEKVSVIPVILGATREVPNTRQQALQQLSVPPNTYKHIQKAVVISTCSIVRKILNNL